MRVVLEVGNKEVEIEDNTNPYPTADEKKMFLKILEDAMHAVGYKITDFLDLEDKN